LIPGINVTAFTDLRLAVAGVLISNVSLLFKKERLPETLEQEFAVIRIAAREGKLSVAQRKMLYYKIAQTQLDHATFSKSEADGMKQSRKQKARREAKKLGLRNCTLIRPRSPSQSAGPTKDVELVDKIRRMEPAGSTVERRFRPFGAESSV